MANKRKRYYHDCDGCQYLGSIADIDAYYCHKCDEGTYIARRSNEGSDYSSSPDFDKVFETLKNKIGFQYSGLTEEGIELFLRRKTWAIILSDSIQDELKSNQLKERKY